VTVRDRQISRWQRAQSARYDRDSVAVCDHCRRASLDVLRRGDATGQLGRFCESVLRDVDVRWLARV